MIKFYYFESNAKDMSRPGFPVRTIQGAMAVCQVYSDKSRSELVAWCRRHGVVRKMIHQHADLVSHVDLWGEHYKEGGSVVRKDVFVADVAFSDGRPDR